MYLLLLRRGLRTQAAVLATEMQAEAATGYGAITDPEIPVLLNPAKRLRLTVTALRRYGLASYRALGRLHAAQYDLATQRWHRARQDADDWAVPEEELRERVLDLKNDLRTVVTAAKARPAQALT
jgi:hypothetical protein